MVGAFRGGRRAQLDFTPTRALPTVRESQEDWSSHAVRLLGSVNYRDTELFARTEFEASYDPQAFLLMVRSAFRDGRYFDCIRDIESAPTIVTAPSSAGAELR